MIGEAVGRDCGATGRTIPRDSNMEMLKACMNCSMANALHTRLRPLVTSLGRDRGLEALRTFTPSCRPV
eukprot:scaffold17115_cov109-Isochrysis_galbana.AAC.3